MRKSIAFVVLSCAFVLLTANLSYAQKREADRSCTGRERDKQEKSETKAEKAEKAEKLEKARELVRAIEVLRNN